MKDVCTVGGGIGRCGLWSKFKRQQKSVVFFIYSGSLWLHLLACSEVSILNYYVSKMPWQCVPDPRPMCTRTKLVGYWVPDRDVSDLDPHTVSGLFQQLLQKLRDALQGTYYTRDMTSRGYIVQGRQYPRNFVRGYIGWGRIDIAP